MPFVCYVILSDDVVSCMISKMVVTSFEVSKIITAAKNEAARKNWSVSIAVVDDGGHLLGLTRMDHCAPISAYIALEKARTSALGRCESKKYEEMINDGRSAFVTAPLITSLEGGVPIMAGDQVVGAIGVSGLKPEQDALIARVGLQGI